MSPRIVATMPWAFLDPINGSDANAGTPSAPMAGLAYVSRRYPGPITVFIKAPLSAPYGAAVSLTRNYPMILRSWGPGKWYMNAATTSFALRFLGADVVHEIHDAHIISAGTTGVRLGDTGLAGGSLNVYDSHAAGTMQGWQMVGAGWTQFNAYRCTGFADNNDGFNVHGDAGVHGVANLYDCIGINCGDEGASPHDDTILNIYGGHYDNNAGGGMNAVDNAVCNIHRSLTDGSRPTFDGNGHDLVYGGVGYFGAASGTIDGAQAENNLGPGFQNTGTGTVTKTDLVSTGNGAPDSI